ncbi:protoporphyrinogen oxidase [Bombus pascuorum]|uniref:protoporphyrinogen oxidase n=1 Tax=Bombus pascuorum TaxID=65598 RepID=UPI00298E185D|nr:protoporphyrinogen oxidase [Bombus pascuorum]
MTAILGGGISGLSAAYYALENPKLAPSVILEVSNRVGGWIRSIKQPDGTIFETGPRVIRANSHDLLKLIEELKLSSKVIPIKAEHPAAKNRYIYADNVLHCLPNSLKGIITKNTLLNHSLARLLWNDFKAAKVLKDDESIYNFVERRFGKDVSEKMVAPILCGICGGDIHQLSAKSFMTNIFETEQKYGSVFMGLVQKKFSDILNKEEKKEVTLENTHETQKIVKSNNISSLLVQKAKRELWSTWGLEGGFEQLPQTLAENITKRGVNIKMKHNCEQIIFNEDCVELIVNGKVEKYSRIISSLPAKSLANLIQKQHPELSKELYSIPTVTIAVVNLQFSENVLPINAFGVLIPPKEEIPILGIIFDSCALPQNSKMTVLTVMMGGAWFEKYFGRCSSEEHLKTVAVKYANKLLCINEDPKACNVSILKDCIPQYIIGHAQRLTRIHDYISAHKIPLALCGSSYHGVGVSHVILSAKEAVSSINQCMI